MRRNRRPANLWHSDPDHSRQFVEQEAARRIWHSVPFWLGLALCVRFQFDALQLALLLQVEALMVLNPGYVPKDRSNFEADHEAALLSLDEATIRAHADYYDLDLGTNCYFWDRVHRWRVALTSLPRDARQLSRIWLRDNAHFWPDYPDLD